VTEVRWTEQAVADLAAIKAFISQDSPAYALAVVGRLY
jgi:plasmid stabilization system protein ParE